jgi:hypothetical protein
MAGRAQPCRLWTASLMGPSAARKPPMWMPDAVRTATPRPPVFGERPVLHGCARGLAGSGTRRTRAPCPLRSAEAAERLAEDAALDREHQHNDPSVHRGVSSIPRRPRTRGQFGPSEPRMGLKRPGPVPTCAASVQVPTSRLRCVVRSVPGRQFEINHRVVMSGLTPSMKNTINGDRGAR